MKYYIYISILLISCSRTDDSFINNCTTDCTTITGRITEGNDIGIPDAEIEFYFEENPLYSSFKRIIARDRTDNNGNYELKGFIKDEELGYVNDGSFKIRLLEESLSNSYMKNTSINAVEVGYYTSINSYVEKYISEIFSRDTIIEYNLAIPKKVPLILKIREFQPINETDNIDISIFFKASPNQELISYSVSNFIRSEYQFVNFDISTFGGLNFINVINITKRKNGILENESIEIFITEENDNEVTIFY